MKQVLLLCLLSLLLSCGGEDDGTGGSNFGMPQAPPQQREEDESFNPPIMSFNTRLNDTLAIRGYRCQGNERLPVTWGADSAIYLCQRHQWLVTVDNENTCNGDDCTETKVGPFIANLRESDIRRDHYFIRPITPVVPSVWEVVREHWVRMENEEGQVVRQSD